MANPFVPGGIIEPDRAIDADQPPGAEAEPIQRVPGGGTEGGNLEILDPRRRPDRATGVGGGPGPAGARGRRRADSNAAQIPPRPVPPRLAGAAGLALGAAATAPGSPGAWNGPRRPDRTT